MVRIGRRILLWLIGATAVAPVSAKAVPRFPFPFVVMCPKCDQSAFYLCQEVKLGDMLFSAHAALLDGRPMPGGSIPTCGSCGEHFMPRAAYIRAVGPLGTYAGDGEPHIVAASGSLYRAADGRRFESDGVRWRRFGTKT